MNTPSHKTIAGGSIDYTHYMRKSHEIRSQGAHRFLRSVGGWLKGLFTAANQPTAEEPNQHQHTDEIVLHKAA